MRTVLRSALSNAVVEELVAKNVASLVKAPTVRRRRVKPWSVEEARRFLVSAKTAGDPFFPAFVLLLVLGLRRGEARCWCRSRCPRSRAAGTVSACVRQPTSTGV